MNNTSSKSQNAILVVGGYGEVGQHVIRTLAKMGETAIIAGRNLGKAQAFKNTLNESSKIKVRRLDLNDSQQNLAATLEGVAVVVMCSDQTNTDFVKTCLSKGIRYLDITADDDFIESVEALHDKNFPGTALLSVGLAPGLTNLLAKEAMKSSEIDQIEIGVLLGVGDSHGAQAVAWTIKNLLEDKTDNASRIIEYGKPWGKRRSYAFNFSDQHTLKRTSPIQNISTYLTLSSKLMTALLFIFRKPFLKKWADKNRRLLAMTSSVSIGSDKGYSIQIQGYAMGIPVPSARYILSGKVEALVTGVVAAAVAARVKRASIPAGVLHLHQVLELEDIIQTVTKYSKCTVS